MLSQTDRAYEVIKARIVSLNLSPGDVLKETDLMEELGLGRTPIREALQRLARDDLVVIQPRRGMYVSEIGITDLKHIFEARIPLEMWAARFAAERISNEKLNEMEQIIGRIEQYEGADYAGQLMESDRQVHEIITKSTGNKFIIDGVRWLYDLTARIWRLEPDPLAGADAMLLHYRDLLGALRKRDPDLAEAVMKHHVMDFWSQVRSQV